MGRPDIVLITVDSLRADSVGYLDDDAPATSAIDSFAEESTLASAATAPSSHTRASVPALLTSTYSHRFFSEFLVDVDDRTIAEELHDVGYETAAFHSNPLLSRHFGYDRGFDTFEDGLRFGGGTRLPEMVTRVYSKLIRLLNRYPYQPAETITEQALDWLENASSPFFLWIHYMDPHGPYALDRERGYFDKFQSERLWHKAVSTPGDITPDELDRLKSAYRGEVTYTDEHLGTLLDGLLENSGELLTVITSDHGEEFREHGEFTHMPKLYEELTRVPFVLDLPTERTIETPVPISLLDITPTLLSAVKGASGDEVVGLDLTDPAAAREHVISETNPDDGCVSVGLRTERYKYIATGEQRELYDLERDPDELENLHGTGFEVETELESFLEDHLTRYDVAGGDKLLDTAGCMNSEMKGRLEDLGYL